MEIKRYKFTFWEGTVVFSSGYSERDALVKAGLGAYNPVAYDVVELPKEDSEKS